MQGLGLRTLVPLHLTVLDVNDNAPMFLQTPFEFVLASNSRNFTERTFIKVSPKTRTTMVTCGLKHFQALKNGGK